MKPAFLLPEGLLSALPVGAAAPPSGTVEGEPGRVAEGAARQEHVPGALTWLRPAVREALAEVDGGQEALVLAWEMVRLLPDGSPWPERRALGHLLLLAVLDVRRGDGRTPLGDGAALALRARELGVAGTPAPGDGASGDLGLLLDLVQRLRGPATDAARRVVGRPGDRTPFILDDDCLYQERLWHAERRLAAALGERLGERLGEPLAAAPVAPLGQPSAVAPVAFDAPDAPDRAATAATAATAAMADVLDRPARRLGRPMTLAPGQIAAVAAALGQRVTLISGGPGTGKTSIVVAIVRALSRLGVTAPRIALAAPTGKAAARLDDALRGQLASLTEAGGGTDAAPADRILAGGPPQATTLHRLLGAGRGGLGFRHGADRPLAHDVVIVDEGSMVDLLLMDRLVAALRPEARLIVLGDADQLPSVEAGTVFRDLAAHALILTASFRADPGQAAGRAILAVAAQVRAGDAAAVIDPAAGGAVTRSAAGLTFSGVELVAGRDERDAVLARWQDERVRPPGPIETLLLGRHAATAGQLDDAATRDATRVLAHFATARILCLTRSGRLPTGAAAVNARFHADALARARAAGIPLGQRGDPGLVPGEPVIVLNNDHARGLMNGDGGVVLRCGNEHDGFAPQVVFPGGAGLRLFPLDNLRQSLGPAYALTVHKAQGSEHDHVLLLLPDEDMSLLGRELVYTALTRARQSATVVGRPELFALATRRSGHRASGLAARLGAARGALS